MNGNVSEKYFFNSCLTNPIKLINNLLSDNKFMIYDRLAITRLLFNLMRNVVRYNPIAFQ